MKLGEKMKLYIKKFKVGIKKKLNMKALYSLYIAYVSKKSAQKLYPWPIRDSRKAYRHQNQETVPKQTFLP